MFLIVGDFKFNFTWQIRYGYLFFLGWFSWTFLEYVFHRFVWHSKTTNSANSKTDTSSHLYHHQHPTKIKMSRLTRFLLICGSVLLVFLSICMRDYFAIIAGFVCGFTIYNLTHWLLHQKFSQKNFPKKVRYHIYHHCRYPDKCFGISVSWWDDFFGTVPKKESMIPPKIIDFYFREKIKKETTPILKELLILMILLCANFHSPAQEKSFHYDVIKNGKVIGFVNVSQKTNGNTTMLELKSRVKATWLAFEYNSDITENVVFKDGIMIYSFYYKKENGKETRVETEKNGDYVNVVDNGQTSLNYQTPVRYNTVQLYFDSPGMITSAYSNHFRQFLELKKVTTNRYRLTMPNNNYNYFNYQNGKCIQVDVERILFTLHFVLTN